MANINLISFYLGLKSYKNREKRQSRSVKQHKLKIILPILLSSSTLVKRVNKKIYETFI